MLSQPFKLLFPSVSSRCLRPKQKTCDIPVQFHFLQKRKVGERTSHFHIIWLQIFRIRRHIFAVLSNWYYCTHPSSCLLPVLLVDLASWPIDHLPVPQRNVTHMEESRCLRFLLWAPNNIYSQTASIHAQLDLTQPYRLPTATVRGFMPCHENTLVPA